MAHGVDNRQLVELTRARTERIVQALTASSDAELVAPSALPGWSRLTIACHLRYGAAALCRMTDATVAGTVASYYPEGRDRQRPGTLLPEPGEQPRDVVASLASTGATLSRMWSALGEDGWRAAVTEPPGRADLGPVDLGRLLLLRLTEVEVHGSDLGLGMGDWDAEFVSAVLPMRLEWLNSRRSNHRPVDTAVEGSWLLVATDGPCYRVSVSGSSVRSRPGSPDTPARAVLGGTSRDLLALLLGRPAEVPLRISGDTEFGSAFSGAFPGP